MLVRRTRVIGSVGSRRAATPPPARPCRPPGTSTTRRPGGVDDRRGQRHPDAALVLLRRGRPVGAVDHRVARRPRRGVAVGAHAEVDDVEALGQRGGVAAGGPAQVLRGHRHQVVAAGELGEVVGVAVGVAVGCHPLVDLPHVDPVPGEVERGQGAEQRRRRRARPTRRAWPARRGGGRRRAGGRWPRRRGGRAGSCASVTRLGRSMRHGRRRAGSLAARSRVDLGAGVRLSSMTMGMTATTAAGGADLARARSGRAGLAAKGVLYVVLGLLAIQFARGDTSSEEVSQQGAIETVARAAVRQVPARRPRARADRPDDLAHHPGVHRRPRRGLRGRATS